jgi:uncharacterized protein DUF2834
MKPKTIYLVLCIVGAIVPYAVFLPWVARHGLPPGLLIREIFANRAAGSFAADVILSSVAFWVFVAIEGRRAGIPLPWLPIAANIVVGLSLGLPLFLYMRERRLELAALR